MGRKTHLNEDGQLRCTDPSCGCTQCFNCEKEERKMKRDAAARKRKEQEDEAVRAAVREREAGGHVFNFVEPGTDTQVPAKLTPVKRRRDSNPEPEVHSEDDDDNEAEHQDFEEEELEEPGPAPSTEGLSLMESMKVRMEHLKAHEEYAAGLVARNLEIIQASKADVEGPKVRNVALCCLADLANTLCRPLGATRPYSSCSPPSKL